MPLKKRTLRQDMQAANSASFDAPASVPAPEADLHSEGVFQYGAKADPAADLVNFEWPGHAPQGSQDDTPTQVFSDQEIETGKLAKPVRRRLKDAEARAQLKNAERYYGKPPKNDMPATAPPSLRESAGDAFANAKSVEQLAQEDAARVLGRTPQAPPVTGELADAPIVPTVDRRGSNLGRVAGERRASSGNMVTATPSNADIGEAVIKEATDTPAGSSSRYINEMRNLSDAGRESARTARTSYNPPATLRNQMAGAMQRSSQRNVDASMLGEIKPSEPAPFDTGRMAAEYARETYKPRAASATAVTTPPPAVNAVGTSRFNLAAQFRKGAEGGAPASAMEAAAGAAGSAAGEIYGAMRAGKIGTAALRGLAAGRDVAFAPFKYLAEPAVKAAEGIAARNQRTRLLLEGLSEKTLARRLASGALPRAGRAIGNTAEGIGGAIGVGGRALGVAADIATMETVNQLALASTEARQGVNATQKAQLESYKQQGQNYGFDVTGREGGDAYMQLKALVGADPKIEVRPNASLREQYQAANKKRIRHLIATGAVTPVATGRPTIKGGGDE